ncbi:MAG: co-chaperone GrpE [Candidatus Bathyarchaeota archaeon B23]|nr:MAG: co-chaperone GrpE [Candidatus Bathyarchaeota archaeon B23]
MKRRIKELESALEKEREKAERYLSRLKYALADLDNLRKEVDRRMEEAAERGKRDLILELLPIVDELQMAIEAARRTGESEVLKGVEMVMRKLERLLEREGVSPIEAVGRFFDPYLHEAIQRVETSEHPDGMILEELRRGYLYKGNLLRASLVKVAGNPKG